MWQTSHLVSCRVLVRYMRVSLHGQDGLFFLSNWSGAWHGLGRKGVCPLLLLGRGPRAPAVRDAGLLKAFLLRKFEEETQNALTNMVWRVLESDWSWNAEKRAGYRNVEEATCSMQIDSTCRSKAGPEQAGLDNIAG